MSTTETTTEPTAHQLKRKALRELSAQAKEIQATQEAPTTINAILIDHFYSDEKNQEFHTIHEWNRKGFTVIKGENAFVVWGKPTAKQRQEQNPEEENDDESDFYPLCYLFSNAQVKERPGKD